MAKRGVMPPNIDDGGRVLGGMLKQRNLIEAAAYIAIILLFSKVFLFMAPELVRLGFILLLGLPGVLICLIGIGDLSFSEWLMDKRSFKESRTVYPFRIPARKEEKKQNIFWKKERKKK